MPYSQRMIKGIKFITIPVSDQDRALAFYTEKASASTPTSPSMANSVGLNCRFQGRKQALVLFTPPPHKDRIGTQSGMSFYCQDLQKTYEELLKNKVEFAGPPPKTAVGIVLHFEGP